MNREGVPLTRAAADLARAQWRSRRAIPPPRPALRLQRIDAAQAQALLTAALSIDGVYEEQRLAPETVEAVIDLLLAIPAAEYFTAGESLLNRHMSIEVER